MSILNLGIIMALHLILDTSTEKPLLLFARAEILLPYLPLCPGPRCSDALLSKISEGFEQLNMTLKDLTAIAVCSGPGSYTGTRVGMAFAKGLAAARSLPLIEFCSLEAFIPPHEYEGEFISLIDARSSGAYVLVRKKTGAHIQALCPPRLIARDQLALHATKPIFGPHNSSADTHYLAALVLRTLHSHK